MQEEQKLGRGQGVANLSRNLERFAVLTTGLASYSFACWKALEDSYGTRLLVIHWPMHPNAPFKLEEVGGGGNYYDSSKLSLEEIRKLLDDFSPQAILTSAWMDRSFLRLAREQRERRRALVIGGLDGQWRGTLKQRLACFLSSRFLHPAMEVIWVTGERQAQYANRLGYYGQHCWFGMYCCNFDAFYVPGLSPEGHGSRRFLYVGRYVEEKGIRCLVEAYRKYRATARDPWELWVAGTGPMEALFEQQPGIRNLGFVQPSELPSVIKNSSAFVLSSPYEPWGVVLQEAAAAGLPLIASDGCGAAVHLLQDKHNGALFRQSDGESLKNAMKFISELPLSRRFEFGRASQDLARQFLPCRWAETLNLGYTQLRP
jgi:glycosyltransferase involved in cell wall biosynthesis